MINKDIAIVYMCAGISSRFGGRIKQFAKIGPLGETMIEYSLNQAIIAGFSKIVFIVGNKTAEPFKEKFGDYYNDIPVYYALQTYDEQERDCPWGTAEALCSIKKVIDCPFVVCNGDDIYGEESFKLLYNHLLNNKDEATLGYKLINVIPDIGKTNRGIYKIDENNYVFEINETFNIEKSNLSLTNNKPDDLCSMNIFALQPEIIDLLIEKFKNFKKEHKNDRRIEFLLPTELTNLIKENKIKMRLYSTNELWFGLTNPEDEEKVRNMLASS